MNLDKKANILIIDDEELICWSLKKSLERNEEYTVSCVYTGDAALKSISENRYDVVITDLKLPDLNGAEILEKIRGLIRDTPLIVISAYLSDPARYDITGFDIFRCVNKPFEISEITRGIKDAMRCKDKRFPGAKVSRFQGFK